MSVKQQILICDDQHIIHETLGVYLRNEGFECISAFDGEQQCSDYNADGEIRGDRPRARA